MARDYKRLFAIFIRLGLEKEEVVYQFTNGEHGSLTKLTDAEFAELERRAVRLNVLPPGNDQRRKFISLARSMNWGTNTASILRRIDGWLIKQKYQLPLMKLDVPQLNTMLTIFEQKVYADYLKALNK
jgi:hypothetical protein